MKENKSKMKKEPRPTPEAARKELVLQLKSLRTLFHDIVMRYQTNLEAKILHCIDRITTPGEEPVANGARDLKILRSMLAAMEDLQLKPRKGRLKDIRRLDTVVNKIYDRLNPS